jgi:hypothetical protein
MIPKEIIGFALVILSAFPMGIAEGKIIDMNSQYTYVKLFPVVMMYLFGFALYLIGFMQIPTKIGFIIGVWEISAVTIGITTAISKHLVKWDREYTFYYVLIIAATFLLGWAADKVFMKAGIE